MMTFARIVCCNKQCRKRRKCRFFVPSVKNCDPKNVYWTRFMAGKDNSGCERFIRKIEKELNNANSTSKMA